MSEIDPEHSSEHQVVSAETFLAEPLISPPEIAQMATSPSSARISERKLQANRANSRRSTGPTSARSKDRSNGMPYGTAFWPLKSYVGQAERTENMQDSWHGCEGSTNQQTSS